VSSARHGALSQIHDSRIRDSEFKIQDPRFTIRASEEIHQRICFDVRTPDVVVQGKKSQHLLPHLHIHLHPHHAVYRSPTSSLHLQITWPWISTPPPQPQHPHRPLSFPRLRTNHPTSP
jgi:hypothetical protein